MKRKLFATLLCLLMMATLLPVGSMASENSAETILSNGDFEKGVEGWTQNGSSEATVIETSDVPVEGGETVVSPFKGKALKLSGKTDYYQVLSGLTEGEQYIVTGYVNAPVTNDSARVFLGRGAYSPSSGSYASAVYNKYQFNNDDSLVIPATNGWTKFTFVFEYNVAANQPAASEAENIDKNYYLVLRNTKDSGAPSYFDEIKVQSFNDEVIPGEKVLAYESFEAYTVDYNLTHSLTNSIWDASSKPKGESRVINGEGVWYTKENTNATQVTLATSSKFNQLCEDGDFLHLRFRAKNFENTNTEAPTLGFQYNSTWPSPKRISGIDTALNNGDWVNYDFWVHYDSTLWNKIVICLAANDGWLLDDIVLSVANDAYVGTGKTLGTNEATFTSSNTNATKTFTVKRRASAEIPYTNAETVSPYIYISTKEEAKTAFTLTAVYKNAGGNRQLVDVIAETLNATASADAYSTKSIDLSTLGLTAAEGVTYTAETYLWNEGIIKPMKNKVVMPITVAAATPEA